jgi:hypothetical protein
VIHATQLYRSRARRRTKQIVLVLVTEVLEKAFSE